MVVTPYTESINGNIIRRVIQNNVDDSELVWHRDRRNRIVQVVESSGWKFQSDNELPVELNSGDFFYIPKNIYHRVLKGNGDLVINIIEID